MTFQSMLEQVYMFFYKIMHNIIEVNYPVVYGFCFFLIVLLAISVLISKAFCYTTRINKDCRKIMKFLKKNPEINNENFERFNKKCFNLKTMRPLKNGWSAFIEERYGYPSEYITAEQVLTRRHVGRGISKSRVYSYRYISALFILFVSMYCLHYLYTFDSIDVLLPGFALLVFTQVAFDAIINWVFTLADNSAVRNFYKMQERLDAAVNLQTCIDYGVDTTPIDNAYSDVSALVNKQKEIVKQKEQELIDKANQKDKTTDKETIIREKTEKIDKTTNTINPVTPVVNQTNSVDKEEIKKEVLELLEKDKMKNQIADLQKAVKDKEKNKKTESNDINKTKKVDTKNKDFESIAKKAEKSKAVEMALKNIESKINQLNMAPKEEKGKKEPDGPNPRLKALAQVIDFVVAAKTTPATYRKVALMLIEAKKKYPEPQNQEILDSSIKKMYAVLLSLKEKKSK